MVEQRAKRLLHVDTGCFDGVHVTVEFVVDPCVPVGQKNHDVGVCIEHPTQLKGQHLPADVGLSARLESDVAPQHTVASVRRAVAKRMDEVLHSNHFFDVVDHGVQAI